MNKLDTIYFEAVMSASEEGTVSPESLRILADNARKFVIIDDTGEAVRFYERIFSLWRTLKEKQASLSPECHQAFRHALTEYADLLQKLQRKERLELINKEMATVI